MNAFVEQSLSHLKGWKPSEWLWRLAILSLPWQTRIFVEGPSLAGYPWEQGRISLYLSMGLMVGYILSLVVEKRSGRPLMIRPGMILGFLLLGMVTILTMNKRATAMWAVQVLVLIYFFVNLARDGLVKREGLVTWFCISLIPHALLGIWQFFDQKIFASTLLGIAEQLPETLGVSVIEVNGARTLRAYGGFPHPNIFGGWLAFGIAGSLFLAVKNKGKELYQWGGVLLLLSAALFVSFSRSAWLVTTLLTAVVTGLTFYKSETAEQKNRVIRTISVLGVFLVLLGIWQAPLLSARTQATERLEAKSFEERGFAIELAEKTIADHWLLGTGQGAYLFSLEKTGVWDGSYPGPPIPPHNAFILLFAELGLLGTVGMLLFATGILRQVTRRREWLHYRSLVFFVPILLLGLFDHYLWSLWAGQVLLAVVVTGWALTLDNYE